MKKYFYLILLICLVQIVYGQNGPFRLNLYNYNYTLLNPAYTGMESKHKISYHGQVDKYDNYYESAISNFGYELRAKKINSSFGVNFLFDNLWYKFSNNLSLLYAYEFKMKDSLKCLKIGIQPSFLTQRYKGYRNFVSTDDVFLRNDKMNSNKYLYLKYGVWYKYKSINLGFSSDLYRGLGQNPFYWDNYNKRHNSYIYIGLNSYKIFKGLKATNNIVFNHYTNDNYKNTETYIDLYSGFEINNKLNIGLIYKSYYFSKPTHSLVFITGIKIRKKLHINTVIYNLRNETLIDSFNGELMLKFLL